MTLFIRLIVLLAVAFAFAKWVTIDQLFNSFQPLTVILSIMLAAAFVRLNRGMPSLEWKSLDPEKRSALTSKIVMVSREYAQIVAIDAVIVVAIIVLIAVGKVNLAAAVSTDLMPYLIGGFGLAFALGLFRMGQVIWRDLEIVELQKKLIDMLADADLTAEEEKVAEKKAAAMKASGLQKTPIPPPTPL